MANTVNTELFGIEDIEIKTPSSLTEVVAQIGEERVMELVIAGGMPSNVGKIKTAFVKKVEETTGAMRKVNAEGKITETLAVYVERMKQVFPDFNAKFRDTLQEICSAHTFSLARERQASVEAKVPVRYVNSVKYMFSTVDADGEPKASTLEAAINKYSPGFDFTTLLDGNELTEEGAKEAARILRAPLEKRERELAKAKSEI